MPSPDQLREKLNEFKESRKEEPETDTPIQHDKTFYGFFESVAKKYKPYTERNYMAVMERLKEKHPDFRTFKPAEYRQWLKKENPDIKTTTINAYLAIIKEVAKEAIKKKFIKANPFEDYKMDKTYAGDKDAVALTKAELRILVDWKKTEGKPLPELTTALQNTLDWFLIGCFIGLRSEDLRNLTMSNFVGNGNTIKIKTSKTGEMFVMSTPVVVKRIIEKYNGLPKKISSQQFNMNIKKVCELAGLNETGVLDTDLTKPLWQCVQAHTSRRTFVSIALYENKVPAATVREWTLHKTESMLWAYAKPRVKDSNKVAMEIDKEWETVHA